MDRCTKHPKYKGKKQPKTQCLDCLSLYFAMKATPRVQHRPTKVVPDKTKYSRKRIKDEYNY